jgi:hypothetical protein
MMFTLSPQAMHSVIGEALVDEALYRESPCSSQADDSAGGVTVVQIRAGEGRFVLSAALTNQQAARATVDLSRDALGLRVGPVVRWVEVPEDAIVNEATVQISEGMLTVSMPLRVERKVRHVLYVW